MPKSSIDNLTPMGYLVQDGGRPAGSDMIPVSVISSISASAGTLAAEQVFDLGGPFRVEKDCAERFTAT